MTDSPFYVFLSRYSFSALAVCLVLTNEGGDNCVPHGIACWIKI